MGGVHKLRLQDEVGRWLSKCQQMSTGVGRWSVLCQCWLFSTFAGPMPVFDDISNFLFLIWEQPEVKQKRNKPIYTT